MSPQGFDPNEHWPLLQSFVLNEFAFISPDNIGIPGCSTTLVVVPFGPGNLIRTSLSCFARAELLVIGTFMVAVAPSSLNHVDLVA